MLSERKKRPSLRRTRLRFGRRAPAPGLRPFELAPRQSFDTMDLSEYDDDLIAFKRCAEADGVYVQIPKRGAVWKEPTPLRLNGVLLSNVIIQLRHGSV